MNVINKNGKVLTPFGISFDIMNHQRFTCNCKNDQYVEPRTGFFTEETESIYRYFAEIKYEVFEGSYLMFLREWSRGQIR